PNDRRESVCFPHKLNPHSDVGRASSLSWFPPCDLRLASPPSFALTQLNSTMSLCGYIRSGRRTCPRSPRPLLLIARAVVHSCIQRLVRRRKEWKGRSKCHVVAIYVVSCGNCLVGDEVNDRVYHIISGASPVREAGEAWHRDLLADTKRRISN